MTNIKWYYRLGGSGDSMTDIGALSLIGTYPFIKEHVRACQAPSGRMYRHPDILLAHIGCGNGNNGCTEHSCSFSRDHTIALCNCTIFSKDNEVLKKFFWHCVRHFGRMGPGTMGQSMQNVNTIATMLLSIGGIYAIPGFILALICMPFLYLASRRLPIGYKLIMVAEFTLIFTLTTHKCFHWIWALLAKSVLKRQPSNLYYQIVEKITTHQKTTQLMRHSLDMYKYIQLRDGHDGLWLWNDPTESGRQGTGIDVAYAEALMTKILKS